MGIRGEIPKKRRLLDRRPAVTSACWPLANGEPGEHFAQAKRFLQLTLDQQLLAALVVGAGEGFEHLFVARGVAFELKDGILHGGAKAIADLDGF
jgi:hypothetical protein